MSTMNDHYPDSNKQTQIYQDFFEEYIEQKIQRDVNKKIRFLKEAMKDRDLKQFLFYAGVERKNNDYRFLYTLNVMVDVMLLNNTIKLLEKQYRLHVIE